MAPVKNGRVLYNEHPKDFPVPGETTRYDDSQTIDLDAVPLHGGALVKVLVVCLDPYLRFKMNPATPDMAFKKGEPMYHFGVGVVLRSEDAAVKPGDHIRGSFKFQQYDVIAGAAGYEVLKNEHKLPWSAYLGVAGMPGLTAYYGWKEHAHPKKGDIVFVSAGAGSVGSLVIQLAKQDGLKVIASAGSEDKVKWLRDIGADVAFNYKTESTAEILKKEGPVTIYWDNVGGETLDTVIALAAPRARLIECGMIAQYNTAPPTLTNFMLVVPKELNIIGFTVNSTPADVRAAFARDIPPRVADGTVKHPEDVRAGLQAVGQALADMYRGRVFGKSVIVVNEEA